MPEEAKLWRTTYGKMINPSEMSHRHLSNIIWYFRIFWGSNPRAKPHPAIGQELDKRFGGVQLPYQPLIMFEDEISSLVKLGHTDGKLGSEIFVNGICVGKITNEDTDTKIYTDVDGWKAIGISENNDNSGPFWIYDSKGTNVAFLSQEGQLSLVEGYNGMGSMNLNDTDRTFDPETQLKQAVRFAYLITQKPLNER